jgi:fructose/tagatose bisphosphate aldolase
MPHVAASLADLLAMIAGAAHVEGGQLVIDDEATFRSQTIRDLAWTAAFTADDATAEAARWIVWEASQALGARSASIQGLYMARSRGEVSGFTVPAVNLRAQTFDMARTFLSVAKEKEVGAIIFEIARSEQTYTFQRPQDFATSVLAGAIAAGFVGPVFIQGDHYQFNAKKYAADPEAMTEEIRRACRLAIDAGYRNIDIDSSTLVDLSQPNLDLEQRENYRRAAELTALIRSLEVDGVTVSVGGEIGEVGKANSTVDELRAYLDGYNSVLGRLAPGAKGVSKVSVQTGTSHGGIPLPGGGVAEVKLDFEVLRALGEVARSYGLAGAVQHGASTLPDELFHHFPTVETAEIHLATGFQNALYDHPAFPKALMDEIYAWCRVNAADERKDGQTEEQFLYTTRKKAIGPFKRQLWDLETKDEILASQGAKMAFLFDQLKVPGTADLVAKHVRPVPVTRPIPEALKAAAGG